MKTIWRVTPKDEAVGQWAAMYVTMNRKGHIVMNRRAHESAGAPDAFLLKFDPINKRIGLEPAGAADRNAYRACPSGRHGGKLVRAFRLMRENGLEVPETIQFQNPEVDTDGVLILDVRTAKVSTRAKRQKPTEASGSLS